MTPTTTTCPGPGNQIGHAIRLLDGVVDCLLQSDVDLTAIVAALGEVGVKTAGRDPTRERLHLEALESIMRTAAVVSRPTA